MAKTIARNGWLWLLWFALTALSTWALWLGMQLKEDAPPPPAGFLRTAFLPGQTSHGHHQIELACSTCHGSEAFSAADVMQDACTQCHAAELKTADDSHPRSKFTDPRNAERAARLDAANCVTCHVEHKPDITHAMGVTLPKDFCAICHDDIAEERPSHAGLGFDTCASSGCHNFHDNRALYEDFLVKHAHKPDLLEARTVPARDWKDVIEELYESYPIERFPKQVLTEADAPAGKGDARVQRDWLETAHAKAGINCSGCHVVPPAKGEPAAWTDKPDHNACSTCHTQEVKTFLAGKHGMRLAAGMPAMTPAEARIPMKADAPHTGIGCTTCHGAHRFDTVKAATDGCLGCHADRHSQAFAASPHAQLAKKEASGELPPGSAVTCATCHMPRLEHRTDDVRHMSVQHNQNDTLRPSEKMLRPVCMNCHSLQFSIDALADPKLKDSNFKGRPAVHVDSIAWALKDAERAEAERKAARKEGDE
ncbi:cytochrome c3 family protein [Methyloversatilis discipulorum]|uniref:cytochrome c3 family protein n=1 Tax=Methyloversatilis discipulorum TaxID=1119528 RepID=UPI001A601BD1|nr:cytochrome c3 family protein [Methyloversatilis discipulorum]MBL8468743.1 cytochrome c3 family protein [Methyloversatilis discipulorum]